MKVYFDTPLLVAAYIAHHPHHAPSLRALDQIMAGAVKGVISAHGLAETFSVLTRAPYVPMIRPHDAWLYLASDVLPVFDLVTLTATEYREVVERCSQNGSPGGRVYDALHVQAARKSGCERIYTFNLKHFHQVAPDLRDSIVSP
ncbi:MAG TPA: PIN domain-containing protein [Candidatus Acidoferrum sp.]